MNIREMKEIRANIKAAEQLKEKHPERKMLLDELIGMYEELLRR